MRTPLHKFVQLKLHGRYNAIDNGDPSSPVYFLFPDVPGVEKWASYDIKLSFTRQDASRDLEYRLKIYENGRRAESNLGIRHDRGLMPVVFQADNTYTLDMLEIMKHIPIGTATTRDFILEVRLNDTLAILDREYYYFKIRCVAMFESKLPIINMVLANFASPPDRQSNKVRALLDIVYHKDIDRPYTVADFDTGEFPRLSVQTGITGHDSATHAKKGYSLSFDKEDVKLFGMKKSKSWSLKANFLDRTHLTNTVTYDLFRAMGHHSSETRKCIVYLNGSFEGLYTATQKLKDALPTAKANNDDYRASGYIFSMEQTGGEKFVSYLGRKILIDYPGTLAPGHVAHVRDLVDTYEKTLREGGDWRALADENSDIDMMILTDVMSNVDGYTQNHNTFYFINSQGKIETTVWDFDYSLKNGVQDLYWDAGNNKSVILRYTRRDQNFVDLFIHRYYEHRKNVLANENVTKRIADLVVDLDLPYAYDRYRWSAFEPKYTPKYIQEGMLEKLKMMDAKVKLLKKW